MTQYPAGATALTKTTNSVGLAALLFLAACGEPVDDNNRPAEPPPPAAVPNAASAPVTAQSPLKICLSRSGSTTTEVNACFTDEAQQRDRSLDQYRAAALKAMGDAGEDPTAFVKGQAAWAAYRDAHCDAVAEHWKDGAIRTQKELACHIDLSAQRAHQIWKDYLTFANSTPPILPKPPEAD